jgi:hypothetical protein
MADDKVAIWGSGLKFGRKPANGELLIGNGEDMTMATLTAGAGASITNAAGAITISATGSGGTVTGVTASSPLASSGGATPNISLTGTVGVANGGTGLTAPGASGNLLTSNGTAWTSSAPQWTRIVKTTDQTFSSTTYTDDSQLNFSVSANKVYLLQIRCFVLTANTGGFKLAMTGPSSTNYVRIALDSYITFGTAFGDLLINAANLGQGLVIPLIANISTGPNAGTIALRWAQAQGPSGVLTVYTGSWLEWAEVA